MLKENSIIIKGAPYEEIKKELQNWINYFKTILGNDFTFKVYKCENGVHLIEADERLLNEDFFSLVDSMRLPLLDKYNIEALGYTKGKENNILKDQDLMAHHSLSNKDDDNTYITTSANINYNYEHDEIILQTKEVKKYSRPAFIKSHYVETLRVHKPILEKPKEFDTEKKFKSYSQIGLGIFILGFSLYFVNVEYFVKFTEYLGTGLLFLFLFEFEFLRNEKIYKQCFNASTVFLVYGNALNWILTLEENSLVYVSFAPFFFLLFQKPIRSFYIKKLKHDPITYGSETKFKDSIYNLLLIFSAILTSLGISNLIDILFPGLDFLV